MLEITESMKTIKIHDESHSTVHSLLQNQEVFTTLKEFFVTFMSDDIQTAEGLPKVMQGLDRLLDPMLRLQRMHGERNIVS